MRPEILAALPHVASWWSELRDNDALPVPFFYELDARVAGRYRFGVPFILITSEQFHSLCHAWPLYGFVDLDRREPIIQALPHGDFDINHLASEAKVRAELTRRREELGIPKRGISAMLRALRASRASFLEESEERIFRELRKRSTAEEAARRKILATIARLRREGRALDDLDEQALSWAQQPTMSEKSARTLARKQAAELKSWVAKTRVRRPAVPLGTRRRPLDWTTIERLDAPTPTHKQMERRRKAVERARELLSTFERTIATGKRYF